METTLYGRIASQIVDQIRNGIFKSGDKLPSVRSLSRQQHVSVSTILAAYGVGMLIFSTQRYRKTT